MAVAILANAVALFAATKLITGFHVSLEPQNLAIAAIVLTVINLFIKPLLKLILSPIIILTLGLGIIAINAFILYTMMQLMPQIISIDNFGSSAGLLTLFYATILTSALNITIRKIL